MVLAIKRRGLRAGLAASATLLTGATCLPNPKVNLQFTEALALGTGRFRTSSEKPTYFGLSSSPSSPAQSDDRPFTFTADKGTQFETWLDRRVPADRTSPSARSLAIKITSDRNEVAKDKIMFHVVPFRSPNSLDIDEKVTTRFFSFDFMLDPEYEVPSARAMHMQVWQCCGGHPPFTIRVTPGRDKKGPVEFTFNVADDALEARQPGKPLIIYRMEVKRGIWQRLTLKLEPRFDGANQKGSVEMWLNGEKKFSYSGYWGYQRDQWSAANKKPGDRLSIDLGNYRRRQTTTQTVYFDNIRYDTTLEAVMGLCRPGSIPKN